MNIILIGGELSMKIYKYMRAKNQKKGNRVYKQYRKQRKRTLYRIKCK